MNSKILFEKTSPTKLFFIASVPGVISMLASALYGLIDGIFVGQILGTTAFAALNLAFPFVIINFSLADLIGAGSAVPIAIRLGMKQDKEANNLFTCACMMIVATGTVVGIILYIAAPVLIGILGTEGELADLSIQYIRVYALCSPVTTIVFAMDNYLRICGKIRLSMGLNILMAVISMALEFFLLYVLKWGIWAAALATCFGMFVCVLWALYPFVRGRLQLRFCKPHFKACIIRQIIACGSPNFLNNIAGRITSILINFVLLRLGGEKSISIYGILMYTGDFIQPLLYGVCDSLQPAIGYNWGAGNRSRVKAIEKRCFVASAVISLLSAAAIFLFPVRIAGLFIPNSDIELIKISIVALRLFSLTYITRWFSFATQSYMTAVDKPLQASLISVSTALIFPVFWVVTLWPLELNGIWLNFAGTSMLAAILAAGVLLHFRKKVI
ncbi:MAG: MATE family efflux transporter [Herbinix sp.]|nr:MATE family efflux transporter [Herbinix sp.]